ncbi:hypothetical protein GNP93_06585 [Paenibacillus validus]|uniref:Uncharacterized protein n=1 Tax=Paenibacillus validus TaxID=44253 RepID=A0A7X2Z9Y2_9BACL|nr:hypothetical protein [Paenibacillus validus]
MLTGSLSILERLLFVVQEKTRLHNRCEVTGRPRGSMELAKSA